MVKMQSVTFIHDLSLLLVKLGLWLLISEADRTDENNDFRWFWCILSGHTIILHNMKTYSFKNL